MLPAWLPPLIELSTYNGDWDVYIEMVYDRFRDDFIGENLTFRGKRVGLKRHPEIQDREATFWHLVSEGDVEAERTPDIRRCERIGWPRAILDNNGDDGLKVWSEPDGRNTKVLLLCEAADYLLVLADRGEYVLPWTAYPVTERRKEKLLRRRDAAHLK